MQKRVLLFLIIVLTATVSFAQDLTGIKVCVNPGHGGHDPANDRFIPETGYWESEGNIYRGLYLRDILQSLGATVIMTRTANDDADDLPLSQIVAIANSNNVVHMHSIHSNATGTSSRANYTLMLYQGTTYAPTYADSRVMANYIGPEIYAAHRTTRCDLFGDFDFYGTGKAYLGVFKGLNMPGTLSESSFHDYIPESYRLKNQAYLKHEAWAMTKAFLKFFGKAPLTHGIVAGIVTDPDQTVTYTTITAADKKKPINNIKVTLQPGNRVYNGDNLNNGFFMFDSLMPGTYKLKYEVPGYFSDSSTVVVAASQNTFADKDLIMASFPTITAISPAPGDSLYPGKQDITIDFSRSMDTASVRAAFTISPAVPYSYAWSNGDKHLTLSSASLTFNTNFTLTIAGTAKEKHGLLFDGNKDSVSGDSYTYNFKTRKQDISAPAVETVYPAANSTDVELNPVINLGFDELLNSATISGRIKLVKTSDQTTVGGVMKYYTLTDKAVFSYFPVQLLPNETYSIVITPGLEDQFSNGTKNDIIYSFTTGNKTANVTMIDNFESGLTTNWTNPSQNLPEGIIPASVSLKTNSVYLNRFTGSSVSMQLSYGWDTNASSWLIREDLSTGAPKNVEFNSSYILQTYVFGDGSNNKFRFCVADSNNFAGHEVSPWYSVNWRGWKLVSWDMTKDGTGSWKGYGNGKLEGSLKFDGLQLTYTPGSPNTGSLYFDDLRLVQNTTVGVAEEPLSSIPKSYSLDQNFPNPFNPSTLISYQISENSFVSLKIYDMLGREVQTLVNEQQGAGKYKVNFNAAGLPSGIYIYTIRANNYTDSRKMTLLK
ncbi:MAG: Ig-like domain-containing protein [Ignavibacteriales bacterium]